MAKIVIYDPNDPIIPNRVVQYIPSGNTPDYQGNLNTLINPNLNGLVLPSTYWVYNDPDIVEMTVNEQTEINEAISLTSYKFNEKLQEETTSSTDYIYLTLEINIVETGTFKVSYSLKIKYQNLGWQYYKYKVDINDNNILITNPNLNDGWIQPTLYDLTNNTSRGLLFSGSRPVVLEPGLHTINLRVGRTSNLSVTGIYGLLEIERK